MDRWKIAGIVVRISGTLNVLELERGYAEPNYYDINGVDVGKEKWEELTAPFYEATEHEIPKKSLTDVFGELLEAD